MMVVGVVVIVGIRGDGDSCGENVSGSWGMW